MVKKGLKDASSWAKGEAPYVGENGKSFADRLLTVRYGKGNYETKSQTEFSQIQKWADRAFMNP